MANFVNDIEYVSDHVFEVIWAGNINDMLKYEAMIGRYFEVLDNPKGLNLSLPKLEDVYYSMSHESRKKMSEVRKGKVQTIETKIKRGNRK